MSTEPDTPLEKVESPWDPDRGGPSRIYRGFQKITGFDRLPAIADIGIGALETWKAHFVVGDDGDGDDVQEASDDDVDEDEPDVDLGELDDVAGVP